MSTLQDEGVRVSHYKGWYREAFPDTPLRQTFHFMTQFAEDMDEAGYPYEFGAVCTPEDTLRKGADPLWRDYCIRRGLSLDTPYTVALAGKYASVEVSLDRTMRDLRLIAPDEWQRDFVALVWLTFERA